MCEKIGNCDASEAWNWLTVVRLFANALASLFKVKFLSATYENNANHALIRVNKSQEADRV